MNVASAVAGLLLTLLVVREVWLTVLHADAEGAFATVIRRGVWRLATVVGSQHPMPRRRVLALAGPAIIVLTFVAWIGVLILGVTLVVWPMLHHYSTDSALGTLTFLDAFYYAGGTVTVLGYGDISPLSAQGQVLTVAASAVGFTMFTAMASYLIEVVNGLSIRNRFTLAVHDEIRHTDGTNALAGVLADEGTAEARQRCRIWADHLRTVDELVHRYPLVAFTYRSHRTEYDPEPALRHIAEAAVAALVAVRFEPGLRTTAGELITALTRLQCTIAASYLSDEITRQLADGTPDERDHRAVAQVADMIAGRLGRSAGSEPGNHDDAAMAMYRARVFLRGLERWTRGHVATRTTINVEQ